MSRKVWNWIYFIGFITPFMMFVLSKVVVPLGDGSTVVVGNYNIAFLGFLNNSSITPLLPVCNICRAITKIQFYDALNYSSLYTWMIGADFVIWLSIIHIVIDVFMLLSRCLSRLFAKFGGAD